MLPKSKRLKTADFKAFSGKVRRFFSPNISLAVAPNKETAGKFAVVVSKKVSGKAAERNLLKRRIFSVIRERKIEKQGFLAVFYPKKTSLDLSYANLKEEVISLLKEAKIG